MSDVGLPAKEAEWEATYFDGKTSRRHDVTVARTLTGFVIRGASVGELVWPYAEMRRDERTAPDEPIRYERGSTDTPEVLVVRDSSVLPAMRGVRWSGTGSDAPVRTRSVGALILPALVALGAITAFWVWGLPRIAERVAARVPVEWEAALGRSTVELVTTTSTVCDDPAANASLNKMVAALVADGRGGPYTHTVRIVDDSLVNAFAAPGGHIVVFRGLIAQSESQEELAGVLAHEIQHVVQQHGLKAILRDMPTQLVISSMIGSNPLGGSAVQAAYTLGSLSYRRTDELEADREGVRMLSAAGISSEGMRAFFARSQSGEETGDRSPVRYLSTHPSSAARLAALDAEIADAPTAQESVLTGEEWGALQRACRR